MRLYTFLNDDNEIIVEVRAETRDQALAATGLPFSSYCYAEEITDQNDYSDPNESHWAGEDRHYYNNER